MLMILFLRDLSYPSKGMYMIEPMMIYLGCEICKNERWIFYIIDIMP